MPLGADVTFEERYAGSIHLEGYGCWGCCSAVLCGERVVKEEAYLSMETPSWWDLKGLLQ